ncbi:hypothetical protein RRG08_055010 [Elysia crispata]|uniref:C-type lectin domain-containing protein n=1 Tax=Elysia crispata TaxID=231223 RepID=A0AAE1CLA8_9GAST|nr:hypothetical protein RRG08_055010 [Elysia crispata]
MAVLPKHLHVYRRLFCLLFFLNDGLCWNLANLSVPLRRRLPVSHPLERPQLVRVEESPAAASSGYAPPCLENSKCTAYISEKSGYAPPCLENSKCTAYISEKSGIAPPCLEISKCTAYISEKSGYAPPCLENSKCTAYISEKSGIAPPCLENSKCTAYISEKSGYAPPCLETSKCTAYISEKSGIAPPCLENSKCTAYISEKSGYAPPCLENSKCTAYISEKSGYAPPCLETSKCTAYISEKSGIAPPCLENSKCTAYISEKSGYAPPCLENNTNTCGVGWHETPDKNRCVTLSDSKATFWNARVWCNLFDGDLVKIPDQQMDTFLAQLLTVLMPTSRAVWIGLSNIGRPKDHHLYWNDDPNKAVYMNINTSLQVPGNQKKFCMAVTPSGWVAKLCGDFLYFICQRSHIKRLPLPEQPRVLVNGQRHRAVVSESSTITATCLGSGQNQFDLYWQVLQAGQLTSPATHMIRNETYSYKRNLMYWGCMNNSTLKIKVKVNAGELRIACYNQIPPQGSQCTPGNIWCDLAEPFVMKGRPIKPVIKSLSQLPMTEAKPFILKCVIQSNGAIDIDVFWILRLQFTSMVVNDANNRYKELVQVKVDRSARGNITSVLKIKSVSPAMSDMDIHCYSYNVVKFGSHLCEQEPNLCSSTARLTFTPQSKGGHRLMVLFGLADLIMFVVIFGTLFLVIVCLVVYSMGPRKRTSKEEINLDGDEENKQ